MGKFVFDAVGNGPGGIKAGPAVLDPVDHLIGALDPYCSFLPRDRYEALEKRRNSGIAGAGMILSKRSDAIYVVSVAPDGAAANCAASITLIPSNGKVIYSSLIFVVFR